MLLKNTRIHFTLWFMIATAVVTGYFYELLMILVIIFIHEIGHILFAHFFSWRIRKVTFLPFGGMVETEEFGNKPMKEEFFVTIGGPLQHLLLWGGSSILYSLSFISENTFAIFNHYNLVILLFNLLPIWPLDGGKLLYLFFSMKHPFMNAYKWTLFVSLYSLILFIFILLYVSPLQLNGWIIIIYLLLSIIKDWRQRNFIFMRFLLNRYYQHEHFSSIVPIYLDSQQTVLDALSQFRRDCQHIIKVMNKGKVKGTIEEQYLLDSFFRSNAISQPISHFLS